MNVSTVNFRDNHHVETWMFGNQVSSSDSDTYKGLYARWHSGFGPGNKVDPVAGTATTVDVNYVTGHYRAYYQDWFSQYHSGSFADSIAPPQEGIPGFVDAYSYNKALTKLYDKLYQTELNLAVSLGEARESYRMIKEAIKAIGTVIQFARRMRRKLATNPSLVASEVWLSYKYGWGPAVRDVYNMLHHESKRLAEIRVDARAAWKSKFKRTEPYGTYLPWIVEGFHSQRCEIAVWIRPNDQTAFDIARITSLNPATVAWELLPLSFVADWFLDVGGYLQNMERAFGIGLTFTKGYVTRQTLTEQSGSWTGSGIPYFAVPSWTMEGSLRSSQRNTWKQRSVLGGFPFPAFPKLNIKLGAERILSGAALLRTILLGKVK